MSDQDAFERILASLHDAMLDDTLWPATSALIDEACGLQGNALAVGEDPQDDISGLCRFLGFYHQGQRREDLEREYFDLYHALDERVPRYRHLPDSRLVHITDLYTAQELQTSPTYNEMLLRAGAQDSLNVRLDEPDGSYIIWAIHDPVTPEGWGTPQLALLKGLLPHIRQFVRVRQMLIRAEGLGASVAELLASSRVGVLHLDHRGRFVAANDRARAILQYGDGLLDRGGELSARDPVDHTRLERLVAGALPTARPAAVSGSMTLRRGADGARFVVHVLPVDLRNRQLNFGARRVAALVLLVEPGRQSRLDPTLVAATLGLTLTESQIAVWLAEGQSAREIAVATGRQASSVRWHLKQIYRKQGLAGQADLVRLMLSLAGFA